MSKTSKILLLITATGLAVVVVVGVGGYLWVTANADRLREEGKAIESEARAFGATSTQPGCIDEAVLRFDDCDGFWCQVHAKVYLEHCLHGAPATEGFCAGVPKSDDIMASVTWRLKRCTLLGKQSDQRCGQFVSAIQDYCHSNERTVVQALRRQGLDAEADRVQSGAARTPPVAR